MGRRIGGKGGKANTFLFPLIHPFSSAFAFSTLRSLNARNAKVDTDTLLERHKRTYDELLRKEEEEDENELAGVVFKNSNGFVKRVELLGRLSVGSMQEAEEQVKQMC